MGRTRAGWNISVHVLLLFTGYSLIVFEPAITGFSLYHTDGVLRIDSEYAGATELKRLSGELTSTTSVPSFLRFSIFHWKVRAVYLIY